MKAVVSIVPPQGTLFEVFAPVEQYARLLDALGEEPPVAPEPLRAEDAYLLHLAGSMYAEARAIIDLAGEATLGASTALWASHDRGRRVLAPDPADGASGGPSWQDALLEFLDGLGPVATLAFFTPGESGALPADLPGLRAGDRRPILTSLALSQGSVGDTEGQLDAIFEAHPSAVALLLGLGKVGEDPKVETLAAWARARDLRLAALRDLSPFLASSRVAALYPAGDEEFAGLLVRIRQHFDGNYDFLALANQACTLSLSKAKDEARLREMQARVREVQDRCTELERSLEQGGAAAEVLRRNVDDLLGLVFERDRQAEVREREAQGLRQQIDRLLGEIYRRDQDIDRLLGEIYDRNQAIEQRDRLVEGLRGRLDRECNRPVLKALALQGGRRALSLGRRHRALIAPGDSRRERALRTIMRLQRRLRGQAA